MPSRASSKPVVELGAFVQHPGEPSVLGRVMATWREERDGKPVERAKVTWPKSRTESDHDAASLTAVEKPRPPEKPKAEPEPKAEV